MRTRVDEVDARVYERDETDGEDARVDGERESARQGRRREVRYELSPYTYELSKKRNEKRMLR